MISYTLDLDQDEYLTFDEIYYDIIGIDWDTVIGNVTFQIEMPKEFDDTNLEFLGGNYGSPEQKIEYTVENTTIKGSYQGILEEYAGNTRSRVYHKGYFEIQSGSTTPSKLSKYNAYPYVIDAYDIHVKVNENNTLDITETITANFQEERHGIY